MGDFSPNPRGIEREELNQLFDAFFAKFSLEQQPEENHEMDISNI